MQLIGDDDENKIKKQRKKVSNKGLFFFFEGISIFWILR